MIYKGTSGVVAILARKRFVGIDRDEVYFEYACRRIAQTNSIAGRMSEFN